MASSECISDRGHVEHECHGDTHTHARAASSQCVDGLAFSRWPSCYPGGHLDRTCHALLLSPLFSVLGVVASSLTAGSIADCVAQAAHAPQHLHQRCLILARVREAVNQWEPMCLQEVRTILTRHTGCTCNLSSGAGAESHLGSVNCGCDAHPCAEVDQSDGGGVHTSMPCADPNLLNSGHSQANVAGTAACLPPSPASSRVHGVEEAFLRRVVHHPCAVEALMSAWRRSVTPALVHTDTNNNDDDVHPRHTCAPHGGTLLCALCERHRTLSTASAAWSRELPLCRLMELSAMAHKVLLTSDPRLSQSLCVCHGVLAANGCDDDADAWHRGRVWDRPLLRYGWRMSWGECRSWPRRRPPCVVCHATVDGQWLRRLDTVLRYVVCRRLAVMEEARDYVRHFSVALRATHMPGESDEDESSCKENKNVDCDDNTRNVNICNDHDSCVRNTITSSSDSDNPHSCDVGHTRTGNAPTTVHNTWWFLPWVRRVAQRLRSPWPAHVIDTNAADMSTEAWRAFGRPSWLLYRCVRVPLCEAHYGDAASMRASLTPHTDSSACASARSCAGRFLCLPRSYFPTEAILTHGAEESWLRVLLEEEDAENVRLGGGNSLAARWRDESVSALSHWASVLSRRQDDHEGTIEGMCEVAGGRRCSEAYAYRTEPYCMSATAAPVNTARRNIKSYKDKKVEEDYTAERALVEAWFLRYGVTLMQQQRRCADRDTRRFFARHVLMQSDNDTHNSDHEDHAQEPRAGDAASRSGNAHMRMSLVYDVWVHLVRLAGQQMAAPICVAMKRSAHSATAAVWRWCSGTRAQGRPCFPDTPARRCAEDNKKEAKKADDDDSAAAPTHRPRHRRRASLLLLCAASQSLQVLLRVCVPGMTMQRVWMFCVHGVSAHTEADTLHCTHTPPASWCWSHEGDAPHSRAHDAARAGLQQLVLSALAMTAVVVVQRVSRRWREALRQDVSQSVDVELQRALASADEALLHRLMREEDGCGPQRLPAGSAASAAAAHGTAMRFDETAERGAQQTCGGAAMSLGRRRSRARRASHALVDFLDHSVHHGCMCVAGLLCLWSVGDGRLCLISFALHRQWRWSRGVNRALHAMWRVVRNGWRRHVLVSSRRNTYEEDVKEEDFFGGGVVLTERSASASMQRAWRQLDHNTSLPDAAPVGLCLLLEMLTEEATAQPLRNVCVRENGSNSRWGGAADVEGKKNVKAVMRRWPFLALLLCSSVWNRAWLCEAVRTPRCTVPDTNAARLSVWQRHAGLCELYAAVVHGGYSNIGGGADVRIAVPPRRLLHAMQLDARCVWQLILRRFAPPSSSSSSSASSSYFSTYYMDEDRNESELHHLLDAEERDMLHRPASQLHFPLYDELNTVFRLPARFVLRQLGLESVLAYYTAARLHETETPLTQGGGGTPTLHSSDNAAYGVWGRVLPDALHDTRRRAQRELSACAAQCVSMYAVMGVGQLSWRRRHVLGWWAALDAMERYTRVIESLGTMLRPGVAGMVGGGLFGREQQCGGAEWRAVQQWCTELPVTLSDEAAVSQSAAVRRRRCRWLQQQTHEKKKKWHVDEYMRIDAGLVLRHGIQLHAVNLVYSELSHVLRHEGVCDSLAKTPSASNSAVHHSKEDASTRSVWVTAAAVQTSGCHRTWQPTLCECDMTFPARGMTALVGPTGAGKSSVLKLLHRRYDALPWFDLTWCNTRKEAVTCGGARCGTAPPPRTGRSCSCDACDEEVWWTEELLQCILRMQYVRNGLPLPSSSPASSACTALVHVIPSHDVRHTTRDDYTYPIHPFYSSYHDHSEEDDIRKDSDVSVLVRIQRRSLIRLDGVPLACFSTHYLRRWLTLHTPSLEAVDRASVLQHIQQRVPSPALLHNREDTGGGGALLLRRDGVGGSGWPTRRDAVRAARLCQCLDLVATDTDGAAEMSDTLLAAALSRREARTLSGGEQQRVALARAVAAALSRTRYDYLLRGGCGDADRDCHLTDAVCGCRGAVLLDEPTSRLDMYHEAKVQVALEQMLGDDAVKERMGSADTTPPRSSRTERGDVCSTCAGEESAHVSRAGVHSVAMCVPHNMSNTSSSLLLPSYVRWMMVVIAHRMSTVRAASHMIVLEKGRVTMEGVPEKVCAQNEFARAQMTLQSTAPGRS